MNFTAKRQLARIKLSKIRQSNPDAHGSCEYTLPYGCVVAGSVGSETVAGEIQELNVPPGLEGHGIGTRLVRHFLNACQERSTHEVIIGATNPAVPHIVGKLVSEEHIRIFPYGKRDPELPMTLEQASQSMQRAYDLAQQTMDEHGDTDVDYGLTIIVQLGDTQPDT